MCVAVIEKPYENTFNMLKIMYFFLFFHYGTAIALVNLNSIGSNRRMVVRSNYHDHLTILRFSYLAKSDSIKKGGILRNETDEICNFRILPAFSVFISLCR